MVKFNIEFNKILATLESFKMTYPRHKGIMDQI